MSAVLTQEDGVDALHIFATNAVGPRCPSGCFVGSRSGADALAHLPGMDTKTREQDVTDRPQFEPVDETVYRVFTGTIRNGDDHADESAEEDAA